MVADEVIRQGIPFDRICGNDIVDAYEMMRERMGNPVAEPGWRSRNPAPSFSEARQDKVFEIIERKVKA